MWDLGDIIPLQYVATNASGVPVTVGAMTVTISLPDGTSTEHTPTAAGVGVYTLDYQTVMAGRHEVRWVATGANAQAYVDSFDVRPALVQSLISLDSAKAQLNITAGYTSHDDELRDYIEAASRIVEGYVGDVVRKTYTDIHSGGVTSLVLHHEPVLDITSVVESGEILDPDEFSYARSALTRMLGDTAVPWTPGVDNIEVTYLAGRTDIPANFTLATRIIVQHLWETQRGAVGASRFGGSTNNSRYGGVDDVLIQPGLTFAIPRRAVELLERDALPSGIA